MNQSASTLDVIDCEYMQMALDLAEQGRRTTHPNPMVGCVIVRDQQILGKGYHHAAGQPHAEVMALNDAGNDAKDATIYVTLEPCGHHGRTGPCVDALIKAKPARVVIAHSDPSEAMNGQSIARLEEAEIAVKVGVLEERVAQQNRGFFKRIRDQRPFVTLKTAISLDGKTAMADGTSQWITSSQAREDAHVLRAQSSAILTGVGTVLRDDPAMTARIDNVTRQPIRVILDSNLSTPADAKIFQQEGEVWLFTVNDDDKELYAHHKHKVKVFTLPARQGRVDLAAVLELLADKGINDLMLEAGAKLGGHMLKAGLVDELVVYMAPAILGSQTRGMFDIAGLTSLSDKLTYEFVSTSMIGDDLKLVLAPKRG